LDFKDLEERDGVVHRLDKGTSGLMVIAKNAQTEEALQKEFQERKVQKAYLALIEGVIEPEEGEVDIPIGRDERNRERMAVTENGKSAQTEYLTLKKYKSYSLLELKPKTGRTHQIRVHLSAIGHPILGDVKYGGKQGISPRIFLHAAKLTFSDPRTGQKMDFEANLPEDLEEVLASLD
jgi:23S rRNA pseudouridine1911/1915/1917 synthase